jgi:large subunit ribosomal protein L25
MLQIDLKTFPRETGRKVAKELRKNDLVPCVFYAKGKENINFYAKAKDLKPIVYTAHKPIVKLYVNDATEPIDCIVKDIVFDPVTDKIIHIDFLGLLPNHPVKVELPVILIGTPIGARLGGKLTQVIHKIGLITVPELLTSSIEIDISKLNIGQQLQVKDIEKEGWKFTLPPSALICSVSATRIADTK